MWYLIKRYLFIPRGVLNGDNRLVKQNPYTMYICMINMHVGFYLAVIYQGSWQPSQIISILILNSASPPDYDCNIEGLHYLNLSS